jgi:hypothetical protein
MNVQTLKWCKQFGVRCDWNLIYGFPGENPEDYRGSAELAQVLTYLDPPTGCGSIRLDRFSPNYDHSAEMGFKNVRPLKYYRYLYPFSPQDLNDVAYYFDFEYAAPIDDGGHLPALHDAIARWKESNHELYAVARGDDVVIHDSRPLAAALQTSMRGTERRIFELCDQITTVGRIQQQLSEATDTPISEAYIRDLLDDLLARHLVVRENDRYLGLPVLTYTPVQPETATPAGQRALAEAAASVPFAFA